MEIVRYLMHFLLNISTHLHDIELAGPLWRHAASLIEETGFDGFELYPVGDYDFRSIPSRMIGGVHLRFFVMLRQIWQNDDRALLKLFDTEENIRMYYGGTNRDAVVRCYRDQLELASRFGVPYVVFHPVHYELEYVFNWQPPWSWHETVDLSAEIINEVVRDTSYDGWILFENLWWPGNFRLDSTEEIDRLLSKVRWPKCGIVLDTGHLLNKNQELSNEREGIAWMLGEVEKLGDYRRLIKAVHLSKSLSGKAAKAGFAKSAPFAAADGFWDRFVIGLEQVRRIDQHEPFSDPSIAGLFDLIDPETVVFEFSFSSMKEWRDKVESQKRALQQVIAEHREELLH